LAEQTSQILLRKRRRTECGAHNRTKQSSLIVPSKNRGSGGAQNSSLSKTPKASRYERRKEFIRPITTASERRQLFLSEERAGRRETEKNRLGEKTKRIFIIALALDSAEGANFPLPEPKKRARENGAWWYEASLLSRSSGRPCCRRAPPPPASASSRSSPAACASVSAPTRSAMRGRDTKRHARRTRRCRMRRRKPRTRREEGP
jgi:hypothetical protein